MTGLDKLIRDNVRRLIPYSCARDEFQGREGIFMDANENPFGSLNRYPDPCQKELKAAISRIKNIPSGMIFLGNGSDEIIDLSFRIFCNPGIDKAITFFPSYGMYEVAAAANDVRIIRVPLNENFRINYDLLIPLLSDNNLKMIVICSPNNPTGNCQDQVVLEKIISSFPGIVLLDEAYIDFSGKRSYKDSVKEFPNLVVMQTFSKAFGLASVRVGMAFSNPDIIHYFNKMKAPYNISTVNQETVLKKLSDLSSYEMEVKEIIEERKRLSSELEELPLTERVYPSDANFILVRFRNADDVYKYLINRGIVVRNKSNAVKNCLRITIGTKSENNLLLKALKSIQP
jgi:histidinol-phosphate aminotransferase